jgi:hypothetical protein
MTLSPFAIEASAFRRKSAIACRTSSGAHPLHGSTYFIARASGDPGDTADRSGRLDHDPEVRNVDCRCCE